MTNSAENRKQYERANRIVKIKIKEKKNKMWKIKIQRARQVDMVGGSTETWCL